VAIEGANDSFSEVKHIDDLGKQFQLELEELFVNYHRLSGKQFRILAVKGPGAARNAMAKARQKAKWRSLRTPERFPNGPPEWADCSRDTTAESPQSSI